MISPADDALSCRSEDAPMKPFRTVLTEYPTTPHPVDGSLPRLSRADAAHLKRWAKDERADEVWKAIERAAKKNGRLLPPGFFIREVLGARDIATSIVHRRNSRKQYRKHAARMSEVAKVLRKPLPNGLLIVPTGAALAERLDEAARIFRDYVAVTRNDPLGMKWTRQSKPFHLYIGLLSSDLKRITGKWLDSEVTVLTEIAFEIPEIDVDKVIWARNRARLNRRIK